jgi:hypothetical protein
LLALAALTLRHREGVYASRRSPDVIGNDFVGYLPSDSASARPGEHGSAPVERR